MSDHRAVPQPVHLAVIVCQGPTCGDKLGSPALYKRLKQAVRAPELCDRIHLDRETCFGECQKGPNVLVCPGNEATLMAGASLGLSQPGAVIYTRVAPADLDLIIEKHLRGGHVVTEFLNRAPIRDT